MPIEREHRWYSGDDTQIAGEHVWVSIPDGDPLFGPFPCQEGHHQHERRARADLIGGRIVDEQVRLEEQLFAMLIACLGGVIQGHVEKEGAIEADAQCSVAPRIYVCFGLHCVDDSSREGVAGGIDHGELVDLVCQEG